MPYKPRDDIPPPSREPWDTAYGSRLTHNAGPNPEPTVKVHGDPWQSVSALQLGLQPRSFDELHTERMYLLEMLQQHDRRALDLFMRVPLVEEQISWTATLDDQKRAKKHRGWLRHRIVDTVEEEKKILGRLCELHVEIQCRERWSQVEKERERMSLRQQQSPAYAGFNMPSPISSYLQANQPPAIANPYCSPLGYMGVHGIYQERSISAQEFNPRHNREQQTPTPQDPKIPLNSPYPKAVELCGTPIETTSENSSRNQSSSLKIVLESKLTKRRSMPSLRGSWGDGDETKTQSFT
ncbi:hypothetical protein F4804DRAFT_349050 [Jackrogersella minutella]|nr:hypothetical protein F4804DRAFT_349050 [Jackrogersella minutella]